jgi:hypothetical protein
MKDMDGNTIKKKKVLVYFDPDLLKKLKVLHKKVGPTNHKTQKRRPFSAYISKILWEYIGDRYRVIDGLANIEEWDDSQFE